jgi:YhcN/YlaJ family sporulation lipoprotein
VKWLLFLFLSIALTACNQNRSQPAPQDGKTQAQQGQKGQQTQRVPQTQPTPPKPQNPATTADRLSTIAVKVPGVNGATAVVFGKVAIVGIDVGARLDRSRVGTIKYAVANALTKDQQGARALVTADVDIVQRLREMNADIRQGRPVAGFAEELADIVGRIIPQTPKPPVSPERTHPGTK